MSVSGHCLCGAVTISTTADPVFSANCHCTDCRHSTGAAYATLLFFKEDDVSITGDRATFSHPSDRGTTLTKSFCPKCGSPIATQNDARPGMVGIRAGQIDQAEAIKPGRNVFLDSKLPSTPIDESLEGFPRMPG
jgi:hypothetical protein